MPGIYFAAILTTGLAVGFFGTASAVAFTDMKSDEHHKMVQRYTELVTRLTD